MPTGSCRTAACPSGRRARRNHLRCRFLRTPWSPPYVSSRLTRQMASSAVAVDSHYITGITSLSFHKIWGHFGRVAGETRLDSRHDKSLLWAHARSRRRHPKVARRGLRLRASAHELRARSAGYLKNPRGIGGPDAPDRDGRRHRRAHCAEALRRNPGAVVHLG